MLVVYFDVHFSREMGGMMVSKALHTIHYRNVMADLDPPKFGPPGPNILKYLDP